MAEDLTSRYLNRIALFAPNANNKPDIAGTDREIDILISTDVLAISMPTLWRYLKQEHIPQPVRLGPRILRWRLRDIERFVGVEDGNRRGQIG